MVIETELYVCIFCISNYQSEAEMEGGGLNVNNHCWTNIGPTLYDNDIYFCGENYFETWTSIKMTINANKFRLIYVPYLYFRNTELSC